MTWRDHAIEWAVAVGVFAGTLAALNAIERQAASPGTVRPATRQPLNPQPPPDPSAPEMTG